MTTPNVTLDILRLAADLMASTGSFTGSVSFAAVRLGYSANGPESATACAAIGAYELDDASGRDRFDHKLEAIMTAIHQIETADDIARLSAPMTATFYDDLDRAHYASIAWVKSLGSLSSSELAEAIVETPGIVEAMLGALRVARGIPDPRNGTVPSRHVTAVQADYASVRQGGSSRRAACMCGWLGPERGTMTMAADDALGHEKERTV